MEVAKEIKTLATIRLTEARTKSKAGKSFTLLFGIYTYGFSNCLSTFSLTFLGIIPFKFSEATMVYFTIYLERKLGSNLSSPSSCLDKSTLVFTTLFAFEENHKVIT